MARTLGSSKPTFKRGTVNQSNTNILLPEAKTGDKFDCIKANTIIFNDKIIDKYNLASNLRVDGTRRFFQCLDTLFESTDPLVFVEVGGCTGELIESFIEYDNESKIYCVEPNSYLARELQRKFEGSVDIENIGLGSSRDIGKLHITNKPQYSSQLPPDQNYKNVSLLGKPNKYIHGLLEIKKIEEFEIWTGDEYFTKKGINSCDILSINTQGSERDILCGFQHTLEKGTIKACKIEIDLQSRYEGMSNSVLTDIDSIMSANGYRIFEILLIKNMLPVGIQLMDVLYVHNSIDIQR